MSVRMCVWRGELTGRYFAGMVRMPNGIAVGEKHDVTDDITAILADRHAAALDEIVRLRAIAANLYQAIGELEADSPGGFPRRVDRTCPSLQPAIDAFEYAQDAARSGV